MFSEFLLRLRLCACFTNGQLLRVAYYLEQEQTLPDHESHLLDVAQIPFGKRSRYHQALHDPSLSQKVLLNKMQTNFISILDAAYPQRLAEIYDPPAILFYQGHLDCLQKLSLGVVGARDCTSYGVSSIHKLLGGFQGELSIVSGLAKGIDGKAHETALQMGFDSVAVIATGLDQVYPKQNRLLQARLASEGLVLSEYPLGTTPKRYYFPLRNRIIAGLVHGLLVVEAKEKSGSLITANLALENNREVMAVPGGLFSPMSKGTNALIQAGAAPILSSADLENHLTYFE